MIAMGSPEPGCGDVLMRKAETLPFARYAQETLVVYCGTGILPVGPLSQASRP